MNMENNIKALPGLSRRSFLGRAGALAAVSALPVAGMFGGAKNALAQDNVPGLTPSGLSAGDIAVLQFLRVAELAEADLWGQYAELATNNRNFRAALKNIRDTLPDYIDGDFDDEQSHADLITAFLWNSGVTPVDISGFYTLPPVPVEGVDQNKKRLTRLTDLTVDTSWYFRYRSDSNPDFGGTYPQIVNITNQSAVPKNNSLDNLDVIAQTAAFHFAAIEQGGSSLYLSLLTKVTNLDVVSILGAIGPTEFYHFALFQTALEGIVGLRGPGIEFPNLKRDTLENTPGNIRNTEQILTPNPCTFLDPGLPACSVIRPSSTAEAGAVAAASGLAASGLFKGQPDGFFTAVLGLAAEADAAVRGA